MRLMGFMGCVESSKGKGIEARGDRIDAQDYKVQELRKINIGEESEKESVKL
jgi:hypothetical protein